jgi:hypothetical protein
MNIGVDAELHLPIWHCGMREAFLMHMSSALNAIKKWGTFKAYKEAHEAYIEQEERAKQANATLALFTAPTSEGKKASGLLCENVLRYPMCQKKILPKKRSPLSRVTRVLKQTLG